VRHLTPDHRRPKAARLLLGGIHVRRLAELVQLDVVIRVTPVIV
jgi:hypothetical protein